MVERLAEIVAKGNEELFELGAQGRRVIIKHPVGNPTLVFYKGKTKAEAISGLAEEYAPGANAYSAGIPSRWPDSQAGHMVLAVQYFKIEKA